MISTIPENRTQHAEATRRPHMDLVCAVMEQAVSDYQVLVRRGVVQGRTILNDRWPVRSRKDAYGAVMGITKTQAMELIAFLTGQDWARLSETLGLGFSQRAMLRQLGVEA